MSMGKKSDVKYIKTIGYICFFCLLFVLIILFNLNSLTGKSNNKTTTTIRTTANDYTHSNSKETSTESTKFTNKYGTPTSICAHSGCSNYIASSGDTNCCAFHSNKCASCGAYIDEDALYCLDCISKAASNNTTKSSYSSSYSHTCAASGCNKEGIYSLEGFNGTYEYYCYEHYSKIMDMYSNMFEN